MTATLRNIQHTFRSSWQLSNEDKKFNSRSCWWLQLCETFSTLFVPGGNFQTWTKNLISATATLQNFQYMFPKRWQLSKVNKKFNFRSCWWLQPCETFSTLFVQAGNFRTWTKNLIPAPAGDRHFAKRSAHCSFRLATFKRGQKI